MDLQAEGVESVVTGTLFPDIVVGETDGEHRIVAQVLARVGKVQIQGHVSGNAGRQGQGLRDDGGLSRHPVAGIAVHGPGLHHFAGGIGADVKLRDLVVAMTASTNSNYCIQYQFPGQLSPQADYGLLRRAVELAEGRGISVKVGSVFTADMFYNQNETAAARYRDMGLLAVEMETAGIYWEAMASHKRALSLLTISDHIFTGEGLSALERQDSFTEMMEVALDTAWEAAD